MDTIDRPQMTFDSNGLNVFDPNDKLGIKSEYISIVHKIALNLYLTEGNGKLALDLGCGYGRISPILRQKGWKVVGVDPDMNLLKHAKCLNPKIDFCQGGLPHLPFNKMSFHLILLQNVLRPLRLMNKLSLAEGLSQYLSTEGTLVIVDNIRSGHPDYFNEQELISFFNKQGLKLKSRFPIRNGCWWLLYLIRYGIVPKRILKTIAEYEVKHCRKITSFPNWQYMNIMYQFCHK